MRYKKKYNLPPGYSTRHAILDILLSLGVNSTLFQTPFQRMKADYRRMSGAPPKEPKLWQYNRAIQYLEAQAYLKVTKKNEKKFIKLTRKGRVRTLLMKLEAGQPTTPAWDNKWRVMIWDIPEKHRYYRDKIRAFVKQLGFYRLQQSVFITPHPIPAPAVEYLKESGLMDFVRFLRVDKLDDESTLKKHFKLKAKTPNK